MRYDHVGRAWGWALVIGLAVTQDSRGSNAPEAPRRLISLDGVWQVAEGSLETPPTAYDRTVVVPGLDDMAAPPFSEVGVPSAHRQAFWHRRTFQVEGPVPAVARLKIHKARYGTKVWLNGQIVGEHVPCFTPAEFDVKSALRGDGADNELIVRVGADRSCLPPGTPGGWDFEKYRYLPGINDSVDLILSGSPFVRSVQIVPDPATGTVRAVIEVEGERASSPGSLRLEVREAKSGKVVASTPEEPLPPATAHVQTVDLALAIPEARLWSPEGPFLYEALVATPGDRVATRFGMRSFRFDPASGRALLNGKPYFLRGTNVCIERFNEDVARGGLPWRDDWVRTLHQRFKQMHWNSIRYCIGFPPERWYDIADEEGFLIQDEFPIWTLGSKPGDMGLDEHPTADAIIPQYVEWMRERWNHPCVVIWDGQNESSTDETGIAIRAVRQLDLSNRPWENGWSEPQSPTDCVESHPYLFIRGWSGGQSFRLSEMPKVSGVPNLNDRQKAFHVPILINEYCWLWLNRDGSPTCLTEKVYESLLGPGSTVEQRRHTHARTVAALTEFWRTQREAAGVLQFCGLGYSRRGDRPRPEGGATSDHFTDIERLTLEPQIAEYVRDAFSPVGLMLNFWEESMPAGAESRFEVIAINDLEPAWEGSIRLSWLHGDSPALEQDQPCIIPGFGRVSRTFSMTVPSEPGDYTLSAELVRNPDPPVRSLRDVRIVAAPGR
jgi:hypothetical protein